MMNKVAIGLLAFGLALFLPALRLSVQQISFAGLWLESAFWCAGLAGLVAASVRENRLARPVNEDNGPTGSVHLVLVPAVCALAWGLYSGGAVWTLLGWCMGICALVGVVLKLSPKRMVHLCLFSFLIPMSLWPSAAEFQLVAQRISTYLAGTILDLSKVFFFTRGNVIGLVSTDFLETQQCAGVRLLGVALLAGFVYGFFKKYSWFRSAYLLLVGAFWVLVLGAVRIAYVGWLQDGQAARISVNESMLDSGCMGAVLFLTWSADQFFSAFSEKSIEPDKEDPQQPVKPAGVDDQTEPVRGGTVSSAMLVVCLVAMMVIGAWQFDRASSVPPAGYSVQELVSAIDQLEFDKPVDGWSLSETNSTYESLTPVFRQSSLWPDRQWELKSTGAQTTTMRLRVDGIWFSPPRSDWLWRWFGWKTQLPVQDPQGNVGWGMSRSIVEQGFVVSRHVGVGEGALGTRPLLQISLVQEGYSAIQEAQRAQQLALFKKLVEGIEPQLRRRMSEQSGGQEGP